MTAPNTIASPEVVAATAAGWWEMVLRDPKFDMGARGHLPSMFSEMLAKQEAAKHPTDPDHITKFKEELVKWLLEPDQRKAHTVILATDYGPGWELQQVAERAGFQYSHLLTFPWKTVMWIRFDLGQVRVSYGYRAPIQTLLGQEPAPET